MSYLNERDIRYEKLRQEPYKFFNLPQLETERDKNPFINDCIAFAACDTGASNCLLPIAEEMYRRGINVWFTAKDVAVDILNQTENWQSCTESTLKPGWLFLSSSNLVDFGNDAIQYLKTMNPNCKLAIVEDFPGSIDELINRLINQGIIPEIIFTTTRDQANIYSQKPELKNFLIIPIGQSAFDSLLVDKAQVQERIPRTKEKLSVSSKAKIVTYVGTPGWAMKFPENEPRFFKDLDSLTFFYIWQGMVDLAQKYPDKDFVLIFRPHPKEDQDKWNKLEYDVGNKLPNLRIISHSQVKWKEIGLNTSQICEASNLVINISSTVGIEAVLRASLHNSIKDQNWSAVANMVFSGLDIERTEGFIKHVNMIGGSDLITDPNSVTNEIERLIFDQKYGELQLGAQKKYASEFRFKGNGRVSSRRAYLWLRLFLTHESSLCKYLAFFSK